ncbi:MAG: acetate--CoA ligase family protein [Syntrophobacteraceae bacterium]
MVLPEYEANKLLSDNGIPVIRIVPVDSVENAIKIAGEFGCPVALKFSSARYPHKSELGGVCLNLSGEKDLRGAFEQLQGLRERLDPRARIIMEPMIPDGAELFVGYQFHAQFGPVISVGLGGVFLELTKDVAFRLLPARGADFAEMLSELRSWPKLKKGFRNLQPVEENHILSLMQRVSEFALSRPDVTELDLNPVIARSDGAWAVDSRVQVKQ